MTTHLDSNIVRVGAASAAVEWHSGETRGRGNVRLTTAVSIALLAGLVGLGTSELCRAGGASFPSWGHLGGELAWNFALLELLAWAVRRWDGRLTAETLGISRRPPMSRQPYPVAGVTGASIAAALAWWTVGSDATSGASYGHVHHVGWALAAAEVCLRYPLTAFAEEAFFRGWLQPRLGRYGPVLAALLWAGYHLQQVSTIPSLVVFGLGLGFLTWWTGNIRASMAIHYGSDALFFVLTYVV